MRTLYTISSLFITATLVAQPVITQDHLPQPGLTVVTNTDTLGGPQFLPTPASASAQTWDYSNAFTVTETVELDYVSPAGLPGAANFPGATVANLFEIEGTPFAIYHRADAQGFHGEGFFMESPGVFNFTGIFNGELQIPVPFTYGTDVTFTSVQTTVTIYSAEFMLPATRNRVHTSSSITGDAFGTMMTPAYPGGVEVVRLRSQQLSSVDSTFVDATGTGEGPWMFTGVETSGEESPSYGFLREGTPAMVMDVQENGERASYHVGSMGSSTNDLVGDIASAAYPNPTTGPVTIVPGVANVHSLQVIDARGRVSGTFNVQGADRVNLMTIGWAPGAYTYRCLDASGTPLQHGRFVVIR